MEFGLIDTFTDFAVTSQYSVSTQLRHFEGLYHMFEYLRNHDMSRVVFDTFQQKVEESTFVLGMVYRKNFHGDIKEYLLLGMPKPLGESAHTTCFVDADHSVRIVTWIFHTYVLRYVMNAPIIWFSKNQSNVDSRTFGSELVAMRITRDIIVALHYKLRIFGVTLDGSSAVMCDNQGEVNNTSLPKSTLVTKQNAVNYHVVHEATAAGILIVGKEDTDTNLADLLKKI